MAQEKTLGLRLGWGGGLSYVQSITDDQDLELILSPRWGGIILTGLYERTVPLSFNSWNLFYGGAVSYTYLSLPTNGEVSLFGLSLSIYT